MDVQVIWLTWTFKAIHPYVYLSRILYSLYIYLQYNNVFVDCALFHVSKGQGRGMKEHLDIWSTVILHCASMGLTQGIPVYYLCIVTYLKQFMKKKAKTSTFGTKNERAEDEGYCPQTIFISWNKVSKIMQVECICPSVVLCCKSRHIGFFCHKLLL